MRFLLLLCLVRVVGVAAPQRFFCFFIGGRRSRVYRTCVPVQRSDCGPVAIFKPHEGRRLIMRVRACGFLALGSCFVALDVQACAGGGHCGVRMGIVFSSGLVCCRSDIRSAREDAIFLGGVVG